MADAATTFYMLHTPWWKHKPDWGCCSKLYLFMENELLSITVSWTSQVKLNPYITPSQRIKHTQYSDMGQCGLHLTVLFGILRQWSISQAPRDSYMCLIIRLLQKWLYWKTTFCPHWMVKNTHRKDSKMWIMPYTQSKSWQQGGKSRKKWNSDIPLMTDQLDYGPDLGGGLENK